MSSFQSSHVTIRPPLRPNLSGKYESEFKHLFNTWRIIIKLFMDLEFHDADFVISESEQKILRHLIREKGFAREKRVEFRSAFFNEIRKKNLRKNKEDCLKFIFKKALKNLMNEFKTRHLGVERMPQRELDQKFYKFYFGSIAEEYGIDIECFYHFRGGRRPNSENIPRSITKKYIGHLKMNPDFTANFKHYLDFEFLSFFDSFNLKKIKNLISKWERIISDFGLTLGVEKIIESICKPGKKFPWTINEALHAREETLDRLGFSKLFA